MLHSETGSILFTIALGAVAFAVYLAFKGFEILTAQNAEIGAPTTVQAAPAHVVEKPKGLDI